METKLNGFQSAQKQIDEKLAEIEEIKKYQRWYTDKSTQVIKDWDRLQKGLIKCGFKNPIWEDWRCNYFQLPFNEKTWSESKHFYVSIEAETTGYSRNGSWDSWLKKNKPKIQEKMKKLEEELGCETAWNEFNWEKTEKDPIKVKITLLIEG